MVKRGGRSNGADAGEVRRDRGVVSPAKEDASCRDEQQDALLLYTHYMYISHATSTRSSNLH